jgi:hypothetical protein
MDCKKVMQTEAEQLRREGLLDTLVGYVQHKNTCSSLHPKDDKYSCDCGLNTILYKVENRDSK